MEHNLNNHLFKGRKLVVATKHQKEQVIAPLFETTFGVTCFAPLNFDTDLLGTFTGEIEREADQTTTLRNKCLLAMALSNCDLGIASEGAFGPHPQIPFAHADQEFMIFIDKKNDLEIIARDISVSTNFNGLEIKTEHELIKFANTANFPSHALIMQKTENDTIDVVKGITNLETLKQTFHSFLKKYGTAYVVTDMRALFNPTRMEVIKNLAHKLVDKISSCCPSCQTPGFTVQEAKSGLPCELCGFPTKSTVSHIYKCQKCKFTKELRFPNQKRFEEPTFCDYCNP